MAEGEDEGVLMATTLPHEEGALGCVELFQDLPYCLMADWGIVQIRIW